MSYSATYYEDIRDGAQASAGVIAPLVYQEFEPERVVDVGCGEGHFGKAFQDLGCDVLGIEAHGEPVIPFERADLERRLLRGEYDLAVCLEVAEHLSPGRAASFIGELCRLAPVVLFSAAIPEQGGEGHQNEQWPAYWVDLFARFGYTLSHAPRWDIWDDERVDSWYRQNLAIAAKDATGRWFDTPLAHPHPVVHPAFMANLMEFIHNMHRLGRIEWQ